MKAWPIAEKSIGVAYYISSLAITSRSRLDLCLVDDEVITAWHLLCTCYSIITGRISTRGGVTGLTDCPFFSTAPPAGLAKRPTFCNESRLRWSLMSKSGHGTYKKFHFETCTVHFMQIVCTIYGKAHGIMQINQNKRNFLVFWTQLGNNCLFISILTALLCECRHI